MNRPCDAQVMKQYGLGPNGAILTSLNLFATKCDEVSDYWGFLCMVLTRISLQLLAVLERRRDPPLRHIFVDTPGQIEVGARKCYRVHADVFSSQVFTWSASGGIITESLAAAMPTIVV